MLRVLLTAAVLAASACSSTPAGTACNGHDALCARAYDQVTFPGTHDAYSNRDEKFGAPDQTHPMSQQLADGVRVLHMEIYPYDNGDPYLCHSVCEIGNKLLSDGLGEVRAFLDGHPREVVTLLMESTNISTDAVAAALMASGLTSALHVHQKGQPWKTLGQMIDGGDRVVAFLADMTKTGGSAFPYLHDRWQLTWETPWNNQTLADFGRCQLDRGAMGSDSVYVVDTFLEDLVIPTAADASRVNFDPFLVDRLLHCQQATGHRPNIALVNYYEVGDVFTAVDILNGFASSPTGDLDAFPVVDGGR